MAFSLGLAILGTTLAASLAEHVRSAAREERRLRADIRLESAVATVLAHMVAGRPAPSEVDGVEVLVADPMSKLDPAMDPAVEVVAALRTVGIEADTDVELRELDGLAAASAALKMSASEEDCFRRVVTFGRAPAEMADADLMPSAGAGSQVDVRASVDLQGQSEVLWSRARFTGDEGRWLLQDHRRLTGSSLCLRASRP